MKVEGQGVLLSASDLMRFMSCKHATALDLRYARGEALLPADDAEDAKILQKQGDEQQVKFSESSGRVVYEIPQMRCFLYLDSKTRH
jgi:hypothetical protein